MSKEGFQKKFGEHLRSVREKKGISTRDLELRGNIDRHLISKIETGKKNPTLYTVNQILKAMDVGHSEFYRDFDD